MPKVVKEITGYLAGWSEAQYEGTKNTFNSSIAVDPDHSLLSSDIRTSGMLVPVVYEKFSSSLLIGNAKWLITNPKNTLIYAYSDNPDAGTAVELASNPLFSDPTLKAYYKFSNAALTTDSGSGSQTLTNVGVVADGTGKFSGGADLGATNSTKYFTRADDLGLTGTSDVSISLWVKMNTEIGSGAQDFVFQSTSASDVTWLIEYEYNAGSRRLRFQRDRFGVSADSYLKNTRLNSNH